MPNANPLTSRATPTYSARDARVFASALERLGFDRDALLSAAGLAVADLDDDDHFVPCEAIGAIIGGAARQRHLPNLALEVASVTPLGAYPLLDYAVVTCDTVGGAVTQLARYLRLTAAPAEIVAHADEDPIRVEYVGPPNPFAFEYGVALTLFHLREEADGRFEPACVLFAHRLEAVSSAEKLLGCRIAEEAGWNGWTMARDTWTLPLRRRDPVLRSILERHADETLKRMPPATAIVQAVRQAIVRRMNTGDISIAAVARELGRSTRSLQRELVAAGTSYQTILDACRRNAAERYLGDRSLPIAEVAFLLGYSEPAAFHRAFRRWRGETPLAFRQRLTR